MLIHPVPKTTSGKSSDGWIGNPPTCGESILIQHLGNERKAKNLGEILEAFGLKLEYYI